MLLFCNRGRSIWYPTARKVCFQKIILALLGISSQGYVKSILEVLGCNNFYGNIGIASLTTYISLSMSVCVLFTTEGMTMNDRLGQI